MQCLFCKRSIPLFRRLKDAEFCSNEHRSKFMQQNVRMAAERLLTNNVHKNVYRNAEPRRTEFERASAVDDVEYCPSDDLLLAALAEASLAEPSLFEQMVEAEELKEVEEFQPTTSRRDVPLEYDFLDQTTAIVERGTLRPVRSQDFTVWQAKLVLPRLNLPRRIRRRLGGLALLQLSMKIQHASAGTSSRIEWKWPEKSAVVQFRAQVVPANCFSDHSAFPNILKEQCPTDLRLNTKGVATNC